MLIAGVGQGPALGPGSARQLNQQIISSGQSQGIIIPLLSSHPARLNPFIRVSPKPQSFGVSQGEMLPWGRCRRRGAQGAAAGVPSPERRPGHSSSRGAGAGLGGEPSVPCVAARLFTSGQPDDSASLYYQLQKPGS